MGPDAAREDQALGEARSLVSDEPLAVFLEDRLEWRRERDVSDLPGLRRAHATLPLRPTDPDHVGVLVDVGPLESGDFAEAGPVSAIVRNSGYQSGSCSRR